MTLRDGPSHRPRRGHSPYTASTRVIWPAVETFRLESWDIEPLLGPFGLSGQDIEDPDLRVSQDVVTDIWDLASNLSGDPSFGLRALRSLSPARRTLAEFLLFNSPTLGAMIDRGIRYERLWQEGREASLERRGELAAVRWTARAGLRFSAPLSEFAVAMVVLMARAATGRELTSYGGEVHFLHPAPPDPHRYEALFGGKVLFSAGEQALLFAAPLLETPLPRADPALLAVLEAHGAHVLERLPSARSVAQSVRLRRLLAASVADGDASIETVARKLRMSGRTLRRRLADEGASYHALADELRRELSLRYLADPRISVTEVAFLLGFADTAAFSKAFRRWTGQTPSVARRSLLTD